MKPSKWAALAVLTFGVVATASVFAQDAAKQAKPDEKKEATPAGDANAITAPAISITRTAKVKNCFRFFMFTSVVFSF